MAAKTLYHYTSIDTLFNILGVDSNQICLRATDVRFLNDPNEYDYAFSILIESMERYEERMDVADRKSVLFKEKNPFRDFSQLGGQPYLLSFSGQQDDLSMWRAYGKDGAGVSIGFDLDMLRQYCETKGNYNTSILRCEYTREEIVAKLLPVWTKHYDTIEVKEKAVKFHDAGYFVHRISDLCFQSKSSSYTVEDEWRLCKNEFNEEKVRFTVKGNLIVPFIEHYFEKDIIREVVLGPSTDSERSEIALRSFLSRYKFKDVTIKKSEISYRSM